MLSFRLWKNRALPWHALVFWVWLSSFVFSMAASDLFHAPHCPDQLLLQSAGQKSSAAPHLAAAQTPLSVSVECAACVFQHAIAAITTVLAPLCIALCCAILFADFHRLPRLTRVFLAFARGPPCALHHG